VGDEQHAPEFRSRAVQRCEIGLAHAGTENDESRGIASRSRVLQGFQRLALHRVGFGRHGGLRRHLNSSVRLRPAPPALVALDPVRVERACVGMMEQLRERRVDLGEGRRIVSCPQAIVPRDTVGERRPCEVRAADVSRARSRVRRKEVRLRVKALARGLEHAQLHALRVPFAQIQQAPQRARIGGVQVISGEESHGSGARQEVLDVRLEQGEACREHEGDSDVECNGAVHVTGKRSDQRVGFAAGDDARVVPHPGVVADLRRGYRIVTARIVALARNRVAHAAAGVLGVAAVAGDDVHVEVEHGLAGGCAGVDADVVAVGVVARFDVGAGDVGRVHQLAAFLGAGVEPGADVAHGNEQGVAGRGGIAVPQAVDERAAVEDPLGLRIAEGTAGLPFRHRGRRPCGG